MAKNIFGLVHTLLDDSGALEPGGTIEVYDAGTTAPRTVYSDRALTTTAGYQITADAAGRLPERWIADTVLVKLVYKDSAGATLATRDYANDDADGLGFPFLFAAEYGVSASNSAAANYTAIEALIVAINAAGRCGIIWPGGVISTTGGHVFNKSYQFHSGQGARGTTISCTAAAVLFTLGDGTTQTRDYYFSNMGFVTVAGGTGIHIRYVTDVFIRNFYENCDTWLRIGHSTAAGGAYRVHQENGEGAQVASSTLLSHINHEWNLGEYKKINVNIEGQRQLTTVGEDFSTNKASVTIDGVEIRGGYMGRFDYNHKVGATRITNMNMHGVNAEGAGTSAFHLSTSSATGGMGQTKITSCNFGTDAVSGSWAASPSNPIYIYVNHASVSMDVVLIDQITFTSVSVKTCSYVEIAAGTMDGCRIGNLSVRNVMTNASQFISHVKGAASGAATIKNFSHGPVQGHSFTNALAGGIKYEGFMNASRPDAGKVAASVPYFVDATDASTPITLTSSTLATGDMLGFRDVSDGGDKDGTLTSLYDFLTGASFTLKAKTAQKQAFRLTIVNTAGTIQHKVTGVGDDTNAGQADYISKFTGFSTSLQNTPTATDSSTAMVGGGKISSADASIFILNTTAAQTTNLGLPRVSMVGNTTTNDVFFRPGYLSSSVNGVTQNRLVVTMYRQSDGAAFSFNTTNLGAGLMVILDIEAWVL